MRRGGPLRIGETVWVGTFYRSTSPETDIYESWTSGRGTNSSTHIGYDISTAGVTVP